MDFVTPGSTDEDKGSEYRYTNGFSYAAIAAFVLAVLPNIPGFLAHIKVLDPASVPDFLETLYTQAWFVGFAIAFALYLLFRRLSNLKTPT